MLKTGKLLGLLVLFKQYGGYSRHGVPVLVAGVGSHFFFFFWRKYLYFLVVFG